MEINLLALGVGNSRLAVGVFAAGELRQVSRLSIADSDQWPEAIFKAWAAANDAAAPVVASSVNPQINSKIEAVIADVTGHSIQWIGREIDLPIEVATQNPAATGIDRILNVAAAYEQMQKACVVVDAGTAVTVDFCGENGEFLGGAIVPGVNLMIDSLAEKTAGIGRIKFSVPSGGVGGSTEAAVSLGIYYAIRGLVREAAEGFAEKLGQWPEIIATGGNARELFEGWELIHAVAPDLGLYGIALAYADHHIKHDT